eukprot:1180096-Prorocentrum_minimum.AAC.2
MLQRVAHGSVVDLRANIVASPRAPALFGGVKVVAVGEQWEKVGNWIQGEERGRASGVLSAPLPILAQEDP